MTQLDQCRFDVKGLRRKVSHPPGFSFSERLLIPIYLDVNGRLTRREETRHMSRRRTNGWDDWFVVGVQVVVFELTPGVFSVDVSPLLRGV